MRRGFASLAVLVVALCTMLALCACSEDYQPEDKQPNVSSEALGKAGTLRVGVNASNFPFSGQTKSGNITGIDVDIAAALADEMGLKLELVDVGVDGAAACSNGTADVVMGLDSAEVPEGSCWLSDGYLDSCIVLFSLKEDDNPPTRDSNPVIGAQTSSLSAWFVTQQYGASALKVSDDMKSVYQGLGKGTVGFAASDAVVGSYVSNSNGVKAYPIGLMEKPSAYCVGVSSDNEKLQQAVTKALSTVKENGVLDIIQTKWLGSPLDLSKAKPTEAAQGEIAAQQQAEATPAPAPEQAPAEAAPAEAAPAEPAPAEAAPVEAAPVYVEEAPVVVEEAPAAVEAAPAEEAPADNADAA